MRLVVDDGNMIWQSDAHPPSPFAVWRRAVYHMAVGKRGEWDRLLRCECASTGVENGEAGRCLTATLRRRCGDQRAFQHS